MAKLGTTKFIFIAEDEDGSIIQKEFSALRWVDTFTEYLDFLRGAGFPINYDVELANTGVYQGNWNETPVEEPFEHVCCQQYDNCIQDGPCIHKKISELNKL